MASGADAPGRHFFLRLRHWELFLMLAVPTALSISFGLPFKPLIVATIGLFILLVLFAWMFSIGAWANARLPRQRRRGLVPYAAGLLLPIAYLLMYILLVIPQLESAAPPERPPSWMLPLHLLSMAGIFYAIWFTARQFKSLQESQEADFLIFSSMFFLLFIFPLGVWIIQPEVNRLYTQLAAADAETDEN